MKKLLILLFSFFLYSPSVFADDISDFEIEGISIGDSLLDYMTEDEILKEIERNKNDYYYLKEPNKYVEVFLRKDFPTYESISVIVKNNSSNPYLSNKNDKFTILTVRGQIYYIEDFDSCIQKRDEIAEVVSRMFKNIQKGENTVSHTADPTGDSFIDGYYFNFDSGAFVELYCSNFEETFRTKMNWTEGLSVVVKSKEIFTWLDDY